MSKGLPYWYFLAGITLGQIEIGKNQTKKRIRKQCRFTFADCKGIECNKKTKRCS